MLFLAILGATLAAVSALQPVIRRAPMVLYAIAIAFDALYLAAILGWLPPALNSFAVVTVRRGLLAVALFVIVMYVGVLKPGTTLRRYFGSIRATLAIAACILILGHVASYLVTYLTQLFSGDAGRPLVAVSLVGALVLMVLAIPLGLTSLRAIRRKVSTSVWLRLQKLAYLFYALIYVHAGLLLLSPALAGSATARTNLIVYTVIFVAYAVLRLLRARADRSTARAAALRRDELASQLPSSPAR
ncbi:MAG: ferric reductase-like transmembrane domain-containing protein [Eggerthellaceae bacterium]|nr:ferric reductase-like transmembrane domain-containing protein [Eggerthellaceae bacterium]